MLQIHYILGWIRGSMPLTNGSGFGCGSGSCYFRHWPSQDANKKLIFKKSFFAYYFLKVMYIIFKDKKSKRRHKAEGIKVFLTFWLGDRRIQIRIHTSDWWIRIRIQEAQKHVDPVDPDPDPDPQHCPEQNCSCINVLTDPAIIRRRKLTEMYLHVFWGRICPVKIGHNHRMSHASSEVLAWPPHNSAVSSCCWGWDKSCNYTKFNAWPPLRVILRLQATGHSPPPPSYPTSATPSPTQHRVKKEGGAFSL